MIHLHVLCLLYLLGLFCLLLVHFVVPQGAKTGDWHQLEIFKHETVAVDTISKIIMIILNLEKAEVKYFYFPFMLVLKATKTSHHINTTPMVIKLTMVHELM